MVSDPLKAYGKRLSAQKGESAELVPAATVVLLRNTDDGIETLMLRKNSKIAFAGMWVFPGGKIDPEDGSPEDDWTERARVAAVREAMEEVQVELQQEALHWFSHWTPPAMGNRRFATWFFIAETPHDEHTIDEGEITESRWMSPQQVLEAQASAEIELAPPTYVTIHYLNQYSDVAAAIAGMSAGEPRHYATHIAVSDDDLVALWEGDAGYDATDASIEGPRHRLQMRADGFVFDDSGIA